MYPLVRRMGVPIQLPPASPQPHTHLAWEDCQFANEHGRGNEYNHRVLEAFFVQGRDIGDPAVLADLAAETGLDRSAFESALRGRAHRAAHQAALQHAYGEVGVTGVPLFVVGRRRLNGHQDRDTLAAVIDEELGGAVGRLPG